jgi:hypothetical protein
MSPTSILLIALLSVSLLATATHAAACPTDDPCSTQRHALYLPVIITADETPEVISVPPTATVTPEFSSVPAAPTATATAIVPPPVY